MKKVNGFSGFIRDFKSLDFLCWAAIWPKMSVKRADMIVVRNIGNGNFIICFPFSGFTFCCSIYLNVRVL